MSTENIHLLANVARWGRGNILGVAFSPDGTYFVVGSAFGFAKYSFQKPERPPEWVLFDQPFTYQNLYFSEDGELLLLERPAGEHSEQQVRRVTDGQLRSDDAGIEWQRTSMLSESWGKMTLLSGDERLRFESSIRTDEFNWDIQYSIRKIYDDTTGDLLVELPDETIQVQYDDGYFRPEGCDLRSFSMCGNVYSPSASLPYRAAFSPSGGSLAILYRPPNRWNTNEFSTLRIYNIGSGQLVSMMGSFEKPVETFAYSPDGDSILVGFVDGSIQLWDITNNVLTFTAWHFNAPMVRLEYSYDGKYVIVQRPGLLEVRLSSNGSLWGRFKSAAYAISPVVNHLAIGDKEGNLLVVDIESGRRLFSLKAHDGEIYALAFSPDGLRLASSGQDCVVRNWQANNGEPVHYFAENLTDAYKEGFTESRIYIYSLNYVPGSNDLIGYGSWSRVVNWDVLSGATNYLIEPDPLEYYSGMITLNPHFPEYFGVDFENQMLYIENTGYKIDTGERIGQYSAPGNLPEGCAPSGPISGDGDLLFTAGYGIINGQFCILDSESYRLVRTVDVFSQEPSNFSLGIDWLYLSPNKNQLIVSASGGMLYVYQIIH